MADLARVLHLLHRAELVLERHLRVDAVQLPEVDLLDAQAAQAHLDALAQVLRAAQLLGHSSGPVRVRPPLVAMTTSSYG